MKKTGKKDKRISLLFSVVFIVAPAVVSLLLIAVNALRNGYFSFPGVKWNDEAVYIELAKLYSNHSSPLGYWGFNGNHATVGTGSAWNAAIILPYALFALVFPVGYSFVYFCNMFYLALANFLFLLLVKPTNVQKIKLMLAQITGTAFILYLNTDMSEILRFSLAIVLAGVLYNIYSEKASKTLKYIIAPILIVYMAQVYTFFVFAVPIYVFGVMKKKKVFAKIVASIAAMGVVSVGSYYILHITSSNYNIGKPEQVIGALKSGDYLQAFKNGLYLIYDGLTGIAYLRYSVYSNGIYAFHVLLAIALIVIGLLLFVRRRNKEKERTIGLIVFYSVSVFGFMYATLYTIVPDTFLRGTEIVIIFSLMLMVMVDKKILPWIVIGISAISLSFLPISLKSFEQPERYYTKAEREEWKNLEKNMAEKLEIVDSDDPWDNTILMFTMEPKVICSIPEGFGLNFVMEDYFGTDADYLFFTKHENRREDWVEKDYDAIISEYGDVFESDYAVVFEDDEYICYRRIEQ